MTLNIVSTMLEFQNQIKIYHWQTNSFSQHKSFGELYDSLSDTIDEFVETFMGKYGRVIAKDKFYMELSNLKDSDYNQIIDSFILFLSNDLQNALDQQKDTDLLNIRDEIVGSLNKTKYLLTLK